MLRTVIEYLFGRKLLVKNGLFVVQIVLILILGDYILPRPTSQIIPGTACKYDLSYKTKANQEKWYHPRGKNACTRRDDAVQTIYAFQMPLKHGEYSRWQQNLIGSLQINMNFNNQPVIAEKTSILLTARLAYRNKEDPEDDWKLYASSTKMDHIECTKKDGSEHQYSCESIPFMDLTPLYHDFYLLNIHLHFDSDEYIKKNLGYTHDVTLTVTSQSEEYNMNWFYLKIMFSLLVSFVLIWYLRRLWMLSRPKTLLEHVLVILGLGLILLNLPLEYLTVVYEVPSSVLFFISTRKSLFYTIIFSFWLIFTREHSIEALLEISSLKSYLLDFFIVVDGCILLFNFNLFERAARLDNPFYSIWLKNYGFKMASVFTFFALTLPCLYMIFLIYTMVKVIRQIKEKKEALLKINSFHSHYERIFSRFEYLTSKTLLYATVIVVGVILEQVSEGPWKWSGDSTYARTSVIFTVYVTLNIHVMELLYLYAPSNKNSSTSQYSKL